MNINSRRLEHQQNETRLVGVSIQESAIRNQIESTEMRFIQCYLTYNENNIFWKKVDTLIEKQHEVVKTIKECDESLTTKYLTKTSNTEVSDF